MHITAVPYIMLIVVGLDGDTSTDEQDDGWSAQENAIVWSIVFAATDIAKARARAVTLHTDPIEHQLGHDLSVLR
jgi:hypothetical protein